MLESGDIRGSHNEYLNSSITNTTSLNETPNTVIRHIHKEEEQNAVLKVESIETVLPLVYAVYEAVKKAKPGVKPGW